MVLNDDDSLRDAVNVDRGFPFLEELPEGDVRNPQAAPGLG